MTNRWFIYPVAALSALLMLAVGALLILVIVTYPRLPSLDTITDYRPKIPLRIYTHDGQQIGEFGEEGTLLVDGVEAAGFCLGEAHGFDGDDFETRFVNAGKDFTLKIAPDGVGFDDCESALESQDSSSE